MKAPVFNRRKRFGIALALLMAGVVLLATFYKIRQDRNLAAASRAAISSALVDSSAELQEQTAPSAPERGYFSITDSVREDVATRQAKAERVRAPLSEIIDHAKYEIQKWAVDLETGSGVRYGGVIDVGIDGGYYCTIRLFTDEYGPYAPADTSLLVLDKHGNGEWTGRMPVLLWDGVTHPDSRMLLGPLPVKFRPKGGRWLAKLPNGEEVSLRLYQTFSRSGKN